MSPVTCWREPINSILYIIESPNECYQIDQRQNTRQNKVHDIKSVHQNDMPSPCVTFLDMDIYQQARKEFPPLHCDVLVHVLATIDVHLRGRGGSETRKIAGKTSGSCLFYRTITTPPEAVTKKLSFQTHLQCSNKWRPSQFNQQMSTATHVPNGCHIRGWLGKWYLFPQKSLRIHVRCTESPCTFHKLIWTLSP